MPVTVRATDILFNNGTTQNTAGITSAVTSAVAGNGISVSGATGAVTFSAAAPGFNTVGSYAMGGYNAPNTFVSAGSNYAAGQLQSAYIFTDNDANTGRAGFTNNLSGTWKWMGSNTGGGTENIVATICRVS